MSPAGKEKFEALMRAEQDKRRLERTASIQQHGPLTPTGHLTGGLVKEGYAKLLLRAAAKFWGCCRPCQATRRGSGLHRKKEGEKPRAADFLVGLERHLPPSLATSFFMPLRRYLAPI